MLSLRLAAAKTVTGSCARAGVAIAVPTATANAANTATPTDLKDLRTLALVRYILLDISIDKNKPADKGRRVASGIRDQAFSCARLKSKSAEMLALPPLRTDKAGLL
jgi:hypothetical protein